MKANSTFKSALLAATLAAGTAQVAAAEDSYPIGVSLGLSGVQGAAAHARGPTQRAGSLCAER